MLIIPLGILIPKFSDKMVQAHLNPILNKIKIKLELKNKLPLSFLGKIETIKMTVMPQLAYALATVPPLYVKTTNYYLTSFGLLKSLD